MRCRGSWNARTGSPSPATWPSKQVAGRRLLRLWAKRAKKPDKTKEELRGLKERLAKTEESLADAQHRLACTRNSVGFRIGRAATALPRAVRGGRR